MSRVVRTVLSTVVLLTSTSALATPPDIFHATVTPECTSKTALAVSLRSRFNQGSHYMVETNWRLVLVEPDEARITPVDLGTLEQDWIDADGDQTDPKLTWTTPAANPIQVLQDWGMTDCEPQVHTLVPEWMSARLDPENGRLELVSGEHRKSVTVSIVDIRREAETWRAPSGPTPFSKLDRWSPAEHPVEQKAGPVLAVGGHAVAFFHMSDPLEQSTILAIAPTEALAHARSWMHNAVGLDHHRAGDFKASVDWFSRAVAIAPGNTTARFNLACAWAKRGEVRQVVEALGALVEVDGMGVKVDKDGDFDAVRSHPDFLEVRARLQ